jgi:hypothetical protein
LANGTDFSGLAANFKQGVSGAAGDSTTSGGNGGNGGAGGNATANAP